MPPDTGDLAAPTDWHAQELLLMPEVMKLLGHPRTGQRDRTPGEAPARATAPTHPGTHGRSAQSLGLTLRQLVPVGEEGGVAVSGGRGGLA